MRIPTALRVSQWRPRFGTGKKTKHVELRFLYVQNLVQMGLLRMAKIEGTRNPADLMTKYVATDVLQRLKACTRAEVRGTTVYASAILPR